MHCVLQTAELGNGRHAEESGEFSSFNQYECVQFIICDSFFEYFKD